MPRRPSSGYDRICFYRFTDLSDLVDDRRAVADLHCDIDHVAVVGEVDRLTTAQRCRQENRDGEKGRRQPLWDMGRVRGSISHSGPRSFDSPA